MTFTLIDFGQFGYECKEGDALERYSDLERIAAIDQLVAQCFRVKPKLIPIALYSTPKDDQLKTCFLSKKKAGEFAKTIMAQDKYKCVIQSVVLKGRKPEYSDQTPRAILVNDYRDEAPAQSVDN